MTRQADHPGRIGCPAPPPAAFPGPVADGAARQGRMLGVVADKPFEATITLTWGIRDDTEAPLSRHSCATHAQPSRTPLSRRHAAPEMASRLIVAGYNHRRKRWVAQVQTGRMVDAGGEDRQHSSLTKLQAYRLWLAEASGCVSETAARATQQHGGERRCRRSTGAARGGLRRCMHGDTMMQPSRTHCASIARTSCISRSASEFLSLQPSNL